MRSSSILVRGTISPRHRGVARALAFAYSPRPGYRSRGETCVKDRNMRQLSEPSYHDRLIPCILDAHGRLELHVASQGSELKRQGGMSAVHDASILLCPQQLSNRVFPPQGNVFAVFAAFRPKLFPTVETTACNKGWFPCLRGTLPAHRPLQSSGRECPLMLHTLVQRRQGLVPPVPSRSRWCRSSSSSTPPADTAHEPNREH